MHAFEYNDINILHIILSGCLPMMQLEPHKTVKTIHIQKIHIQPLATVFHLNLYSDGTSSAISTKISDWHSSSLGAVPVALWDGVVPTHRSLTSESSWYRSPTASSILRTGMYRLLYILYFAYYQYSDNKSIYIWCCTVPQAEEALKPCNIFTSVRM